jgi:hypothetical protein
MQSIEFTLSFAAAACAAAAFIAAFASAGARLESSLNQTQEKLETESRCFEAALVSCTQDSAALLPGFNASECSTHSLEEGGAQRAMALETN